MGLIKTSALNGIGTVIKLACAILLNKILAIYVGPAGFAIIGQTQNIVSIFSGIAGALGSQGVVKLTAEKFDDPKEQHKIWKTSITLSIIISFIIGTILLIKSKYILELIDVEITNNLTIYILVIFLPIISINNIILSILNGKKEIKLYVLCGIIGSILSLALILILTIIYNIQGAILGLIIAPGLSILTNILLVRKKDWFKYNFLIGGIHQKYIKELSEYGLMAVISTVASSLTFILIRKQIERELGLEYAGYWQGSWKISETYLMVLTSSLGIYYLPRIAEIGNNKDLKKEIKYIYGYFMPVVIISGLSIYILRDFIIKMLFTVEFMEMRQLFALQIFGDIIKIASWILSYILVAKKFTKFFIFTEIIFSLSFYALVVFALPIYGIQGVPLAYTINYILYFICIAFYVKNYIFIKIDN